MPSDTIPLAEAERRLRWRLISGNVLLILLLAVLTWVALAGSRTAYRQRALDATANLAHSLEQTLDGELALADMSLKAVAQAHAQARRRGGLDDAAFEQAITSWESLAPGIVSLRVADAQGRVRWGRGLPSDSVVSVSDRAYFQRARDTHQAALIVDGPMQARISKTWVLVLARRLDAADGSFAGVVYANLATERLEHLFASVALGPKGAISLRTDSLVLIARYGGGGAAPVIGSSKVSTQLREAVAREPDRGTYIAVTAMDQIERANAYARVHDYPLLVIVGQATEDYLRAWRDEAAMVIGLAVLTAALLVGASTLVWRSSRRDRALQQALRASQDFLDRTGRVAAVGGWEMDLDSRLISWSDQTCRMHDVPVGFRPTPEQAMGHFAAQEQEKIRAGIDQTLRIGAPWDLELPMVTANGREIWVRIFGDVQREDGRARRLVGAIQDVTELRQRRLDLRREQLLRARSERHADKLDHLLRERSDMLDVLAHEVRQPLNNASAALQGAAAALSRAGDELTSSHLNRARTVMGQVLANIDNTLAVAALLARAEPIQREDTDIDTLLAVVIADLPADERGRCQIQRLTRTRTASMDMSLMRLALRNLLANALRYSPPGSPVMIRLTDSDEPLALIIDVIDEGGGIDEALAPQVFERGTRGAHLAGPSGHGVGLYIVRRVMELHAGQADLLTTSAQGTTMRLILVQLS
jgi:PAS domain S-box-containing protein